MMNQTLNTKLPVGLGRDLSEVRNFFAVYVQRRSLVFLRINDVAYRRREAAKCNKVLKYNVICLKLSWLYLIS